MLLELIKSSKMVVDQYMLPITDSIVEITHTNKRTHLHLFEALSVLAKHNPLSFVQSKNLDTIFGPVLYSTLGNAFR